MIPSSRPIVAARPLVAVLALLGLALRPTTGAGQGQVSARTVTCESRGGQRSECPIPGGAKVELRRTLSQAACESGRSWGVNGARLWVDRGCRGEFTLVEGPAGSGRRFTCASVPGERAECPVAGGVTVTLLRQVGQTACVRGRTWGLERGTVWVTDGCAAEFEVAPGPDARAARPFRVVCESEGGARNECLAGPAVVLVRQLSRAECVEGRTWGLSQGRVWVENGCRAEFEVRPE